jgi:hypothetical protein
VLQVNLNMQPQDAQCYSWVWASVPWPWSHTSIVPFQQCLCLYIWRHGREA